MIMRAILCGTWQSIPTEQFLIIPSGRLRREPFVVLQEVLNFLDLPAEADQSSATSTVDVSIDGGGEVIPQKVVTLNGQQALIRAAVEKHFPSKTQDISCRGD